ncbi:MAG: LysR family transcriptional regulator [Bacilli bacterium]|nr:LysR family transcriptional regulator [Bacilli bacterium]
MEKYQTPVMNLNLVRTFVIVGQSKDLNDAAHKLDIDRTNVSRHIAALESIYETKLLNNDSKTFELTEDGKKLFDDYEKAYNLMFAAEKNFRQGKSLNTGRLTIGFSSDVDPNFVNRKIELFKKKYPNVVIKILVLPTQDLYDKLAQFYMDFIIDTPIDSIQKVKNIEMKELGKEPFCIAYSKKLYNLKIESIKDLDNLPLILPISAKKERSEFDKILEKEEINKNISLEVDDYHFALEYAKSGLGFALLPKRCVTEELLIVDIDLTKTISVAYIEKNLCPAAKKLLEEFDLIK